MSDEDTDTLVLPDNLEPSQAQDVLQEYASHDEAEIVDADEWQSRQSTVDKVKEFLAGALSEQTGMSQETLSNQSLDALAEPFETEDGEIEVDTLSQEPETQEETPTEDADEDGDDGFNPDTLGRSTVDNLRQKNHKRKTFLNRDVESRADALEQEMVEEVGAPDFETLESEVL